MATESTIPCPREMYASQAAMLRELLGERLTSNEFEIWLNVFMDRVTNPRKAGEFVNKKESAIAQANEAGALACEAVLAYRAYCPEIALPEVPATEGDDAEVPY